MFNKATTYIVIHIRLIPLGYNPVSAADTMEHAIIKAGRVHTMQSVKRAQSCDYFDNKTLAT